MPSGSSSALSCGMSHKKPWPLIQALIIGLLLGILIYTPFREFFLLGCFITQVTCQHPVLDEVRPKRYGRLLTASLLYNVRWLSWLFLFTLIGASLVELWTSGFEDIVSNAWKSILDIFMVYFLVMILLVAFSFISAFWYTHSATVGHEALDEDMLGKQR